MLQPQQLPGTNADVWDWQIDGLCRGVDSSVFFHPDGERGRARAIGVYGIVRNRPARTVCKTAAARCERDREACTLRPGHLNVALSAEVKLHERTRWIGNVEYERVGRDVHGLGILCAE